MKSVVTSIARSLSVWCTRQGAALIKRLMGSSTSVIVQLSFGVDIAPAGASLRESGQQLASHCPRRSWQGGVNPRNAQRFRVPHLVSRGGWETSFCLL